MESKTIEATPAIQEDDREGTGAGDAFLEDLLVSSEVREEDDHVLIEAKKDIVLRCGKASITLTKEGKIILRGEYVLSAATGMNLIKGGAVEIN